MSDTILTDKTRVSKSQKNDENEDVNENENENVNENDETLMSSDKVDDDKIIEILMYSDEYAETMDQN